MVTALHTLRDRVISSVWGEDLRTVRGWRRYSIEAVRLLFTVVREFIGGELNLRAMSLVYTSLLSLVPLLAVSFSMLKAFGVHNRLEPTLIGFLGPLGDRGTQLAVDIVGFVENVKVGVLGSVGLAVLIYTVVSLLQKIEEALNFVWRIGTLRSLSRRVSGYLTVVMIGPVLIYSGLTFSDSARSSLARLLGEDSAFNTLIVEGSKLVPYLLVWAAFTFIYVFVPNTRVRFVPAAVGGLISGILWRSTAWGFGAFMASSARYSEIYAGFAVVVLLLIWLYLNWLILLLGAQIAFYVQNPQYLTFRPSRHPLSNQAKERLALVVMLLVGTKYYRDEPGWTLDTLVEHLQLPSEHVHDVLTLLMRQGYLQETADDPPAYLPDHDIGNMEVAPLLQSVRHAYETGAQCDDHLPELSPVDDVMTRARLAVDGALEGVTLRALITAKEQDPR